MTYALNTPIVWEAVRRDFAGQIGKDIGDQLAHYLYNDGQLDMEKFKCDVALLKAQDVTRYNKLKDMLDLCAIFPQLMIDGIESGTEQAKADIARLNSLATQFDDLLM